MKEEHSRDDLALTFEMGSELTNICAVEASPSEVKACEVGEPGVFKDGVHSRVANLCAAAINVNHVAQQVVTEHHRHRFGVGILTDELQGGGKFKLWDLLPLERARHPEVLCITQQIFGPHGELLLDVEHHTLLNHRVVPVAFKAIQITTQLLPCVCARPVQKAPDNTKGCVQFGGVHDVLICKMLS